MPCQPSSNGPSRAMTGSRPIVMVTARMPAVSALGERLRERASDCAQRGDRDEPGDHDHAVDVDRGDEADFLALDHIGAQRTRRHAVAAAPALALLVGPFARATATAPADLRHGDERDPVVLYRIAENALHGHG